MTRAASLNLRPVNRLDTTDVSRFTNLLRTMKKRAKTLKAWAYGLVGAFIVGGSSAITAGVTIVVVAPDRFNFHEMIGNTLTVMFSVFFISGLQGAFAYLSKSPLPSIDENEHDHEND